MDEIPVGTTLVGNVGTWQNMNSEAFFSYQWLSAGEPIPPDQGGTDINYVTQVSDEGNYITFAVTATNEVGSVTVVSAPVGPVSGSQA